VKMSNHPLRLISQMSASPQSRTLLELYYWDLHVCR